MPRGHRLHLELAKRFKEQHRNGCYSRCDGDHSRSDFEIWNIEKSKKSRRVTKLIRRTVKRSATTHFTILLVNIHEGMEELDSQEQKTQFGK
ncbi:unnamed protein product [Cylicocyclus nassatus]|uniref:Uncharacterized protein n=1 Tax=Cylicocyclus nassatus TaxID=53992 RepID=A0AA36H7M3_CYLNA|nr:unnamed protein product [Cylicocyclus nassatus]